MNQSATLAVVGGDVRQAYLASLLRADGHTVRTYALERRPVEGCAAVSDPRAGFADVQAVILPLPIQHGDARSRISWTRFRRVRLPLPARSRSGYTPALCRTTCVCWTTYPATSLRYATRYLFPLGIGRFAAANSKAAPGAAMRPGLLFRFNRAACGRNCPPPGRSSGY